MCTAVKIFCLGGSPWIEAGSRRALIQVEGSQGKFLERERPGASAGSRITD